MDQRPSDVEERMRRATAAAAKGAGSRDELEAAARALVLELRSADAPPEQMLMRIKDILAESGLRAAYASTDSATPMRGEAAIYRSVIEWSIRQYYEDHKTDHHGNHNHDGRSSFPQNGGTGK